jgi:hypothetical protein
MLLNIKEILPLLIPVIILQLGLQITAIINLVRRNKVRFNNKFLWGIVIVVFGMLGTVVYFVARGEEE